MRRRVQKKIDPAEAKALEAEKRQRSRRAKKLEQLNPLAKQTQKLIAQRVEADLATAAIKRGLCEDVVNLKAEGYSHNQIADKLGISTIEVATKLVEGLSEYFAERDEAVSRYLAVANARYDRIFRTWLPRAESRVVVTEGAMGERVEVVYPPDPDAAKVVLTAMRDAARMMGLNKVRVEHTGKDGGAIEVDIDWNSLTDEQLEKFKSTNDIGVLRAFAGTVASACRAGDSTSTGSEG